MQNNQNQIFMPGLRIDPELLEDLERQGEFFDASVSWYVLDRYADYQTYLEQNSGDEKFVLSAHSLHWLLSTAEQYWNQLLTHTNQTGVSKSEFKNWGEHHLSWMGHVIEFSILFSSMFILSGLGMYANVGPMYYLYGAYDDLVKTLSVQVSGLVLFHQTFFQLMRESLRLPIRQRLSYQPWAELHTVPISTRYIVTQLKEYIQYYETLSLVSKDFYQWASALDHQSYSGEDLCQLFSIGPIGSNILSFLAWGEDFELPHSKTQVCHFSKGLIFSKVRHNKTGLKSQLIDKQAWPELIDSLSEYKNVDSLFGYKKM